MRIKFVLSSLMIVLFCMFITDVFGANDKLPAAPLDSKKAFFDLLRSPRGSVLDCHKAGSEDNQAKCCVDVIRQAYERAGYSFEKTVIAYSRKYKANPHFHTEDKYLNTVARMVWSDVNLFTEYSDGSSALDELPYKKYFSKEEYKALEIVADTNKKLAGKKIQ